MGSCTAGGAYVPAMSDETVIVKDQGTIFLGGPPLVKAATGEVVTAEDLGGGDVHARKSGVVDHLADDDADALAIVRSIVGDLRARGRRPRSSRTSRRGAGRGPARLYDVVPTDTAHAVRRPRGDPPDRRRQRGSTSSRRSTARRWSAASPASGATRSASSPTTASCSPSRRSRARTSSSCATSAASRWCSCRTSPASWSAASTRTAASPRTAPSWSRRSPARSCPKFTVVIGGSFGAGNYGMCGRAYDPRFLWMWPNARISVMGGEQAASVLATVRRDGIEARGEEWSAEDEEAFKAPIRDQYEHAGLAVLLHRAALGRRRHRPRRHPPRARPGPGRRGATRRSPSPPSASSGCEP